MLRALRVARPRPAGTAAAPDHTALAKILDRVRINGVGELPGLLDSLDAYVATLATVDPTTLTRSDALAYWLNLYNAGALTLAGETVATGEPSVLRLPGAFTRPFVSVNGEHLSLDDIEHGKVRRFKDPRIHAALVCGSASCPTLRYEPFNGARLDSQLDDQLRTFLAAGGARVEEDMLLLSRVFLWYGSDFVRPRRMPSFIPVRRRQVAQALEQWLPPHVRTASGNGGVSFQDYDWTLACSVRSPA